MRTIWKYAVLTLDDQTIEIPEGARLLHVDDQSGWIMLWALVDPDARRVSRQIRVVGTGHPIPDDLVLVYVGSLQQANGNLVWHIFDGGEVER